MAPEINAAQASILLTQALDFLGQQAPKDLSKQSANDILQWAKQHWNITKVGQKRSIALS
jgi:hypothetical protein